MIILFESLGTGNESPIRLEHVESTYQWLDANGFQNKWIRTDYQFESLDEAVDLAGFSSVRKWLIECARSGWSSCLNVQVYGGGSSELGIQWQGAQRPHSFCFFMLVLFKYSFIVGSFVSAEHLSENVGQFSIGGYIQFLQQNIDILLETRADRAGTRIFKFDVLPFPVADVFDTPFHFFSRGSSSSPRR